MRHRTGRRVIDAVAVDVCRGRGPEVPDLPGIEDELVHRMRFHRISPLAHVALRQTRPDLATLLREDRDRALNHHVRATTSLAAITGTLEGVPWLTFKGPVLSETLHPVAGLRSYGDLDVIVAPEHLREACARLLGAGWHVLASREDLLNGEVTGELELGRPGGVVIDLHWSLVISETMRRRFRIVTADLLERSVPVLIGPVASRTLDATDTLVHLCLHAASEGAVRLVHLLDVDQAARRIQDWDRVARRARSWGVEAQVGLVLSRARRLLGTLVPEGFDRQLGLSRSFGALVAGVDLVRPVPAVRSEASWSRLVARAAVPSATATAVRALRNAGMGVVNRARPVPAPPDGTVPAGRDDVEEWLSAVERVAGTAVSTR